MTRLPLAVLTALTALAWAAPAGAAAPQPRERPLRNVDVRKADGGPVPAQERRARATLARELGDEGTVSTDRVGGGARLVARTDGFLTPRRAAPAADVALDYVRERPAVFGVGAADLAGLRLTNRYSSDDGVTHLAYTQTYRGIGAYDNALLANVDGDGRLLNIGGSAVSDPRVPTIVPDLDAEAALAAARQDVGGSLVPPRATQGSAPDRPTSFAGGDAARLVLFNDRSTTRLAWRLQVTGAHGYMYEIVIAATSGAVLERRSLTEFVSNAAVYENYPGAASGGTPAIVDLAADPTWLNQSAGDTQLSGNNAHAYADADATEGLSPGDFEIPASAGTDWLYPLIPFFLPGCPATGCTWDRTDPASRAVNRNQATTQLFYLVNTFHDHLKAAPIGFTPAARNFELVGPPGVGGDPVLAESDNSVNAPAPPATTSTDNSSMTTLPDGVPPRLEMFLFTNPTSVDAADAADLVYHEYTHGLTNRSIGSGAGLSADQPRAMGEGWSDWYALDFLENQLLRVDHPGTRGEMTIGDYVQPGGLRTQGADCPVGSSDPACPGRGPGNRGGYTFGDLGNVGAPGFFEVHADGEIWLETLWDLRAALGTSEAERLITSGLRLSPNNPSFLEARDAILLADQISGGADNVALWSVFAGRGMGYSARTASPSAHSATEAFDLPPRLVHESTTVSDPAPGGDGDDVAEPGETVSVTEALHNPHAGTVGAITGVLSTSTPHVGVPQRNAAWAPVTATSTQSNSPPFRVAIPTSASCDTNVQLSLAATTNDGNFVLPLQVPLGSKASTDVPKDIPAPATGVDSTLTFNGPGTVQGLKVRIDTLSHTFVGDLKVTLTSPLGTTVTLMDRPGTEPTFGAQGDDFSNLVLDDGAATAIDDIPDVNPPGGYTGSFRPDQPLSTFNGEDRQGAWTLHVSDQYAPADTGALHGWSLRPSSLGCANSAPIAVDDAFTVLAGQTLSASTVLANDTDADGNALTAVKASDPAHGTVDLAANGTFTYVPDPGYVGPDSFTYRASDGILPSPDPAIVSIAVRNGAPIAVDDAYAVAAGTTLAGSSVLANDSDPNGDPLTAAAVSGASNGTLGLAADGTFTYTPQAGFSGRDTFTYRAADASDSSAPATVTVTVAAAPAPPPPPPPPPPRAAAKLQVLRAGVSAGKLDVLASITARATGNVRVSYRSAGVTTVFDAPISGGQIRFRKTLPRSQRAKPTGIFTLRFAGTSLVAPDSVTLRAARGKARLVRTTSAIDSSGRLHAAGTITPRARGIVRVRLGYLGAGGVLTFLDYRAKIAGGRWALTQQLPPAAAKAGGLLSIQFTGYEPLRIRGEQIAKEVAPGG